MTAPPVLEVRNLSKYFQLQSGALPGFRRRQQLHAVERVSFAIHPSEAVGLVGESGCGKSTLSRVISRLIDPTEGQILLDGEDITSISAERFARSPRRREVQMVFQDPTDSLNPRFTVFDLIADPVRQLTPADRATIAAKVDAAIDAVNLPSALLGRYPHQLSGGQKARVGIARALAVQPKLLVLDEPTSALDVSVQATVLQLLDRLRRDRGIALLFVGHDLNVVRLLCSRIVVMYLGEVVESGTTEQLFKAPRHPYTQALLSAIPSLRRSSRPRIHLDGDLQSPIDPAPTRCRLYGRCAIQQDRCMLEAPQLKSSPDAHQVRCHFSTT